MNTVGEYKKIIQSFKDYKIVSRITEPTGQLFIRHDVDFDIDLALSLAKVEYDMGIQSVYFIMTTSFYYNIHSEQIFQILLLGHDVLLHFDHKFSLLDQLDSFVAVVGYFPDLISIHRPRKKESDISYMRIENTYSDKYSKDAKYFSDANCQWRYSYPEPQKDNRTVQLLTHPVWWMMDGRNEQEKVERFIIHRRATLTKELKKSLRTFT